MARRKSYTVIAGIEPSTNLVRGLELAHLWGFGQALSSSSSWSGTTSPLRTTLVTLTQHSRGGGHSEARFTTRLFFCLSNKWSSTAILLKPCGWWESSRSAQTTLCGSRPGTEGARTALTSCSASSAWPHRRPPAARLHMGRSWGFCLMSTPFPAAYCRISRLFI